MTKISSHQANGWPTLQRQVFAWALCVMLALSVIQVSLAQVPAPVAVGQTLPALNLKDQHDKAWQITPSTRLVMFAAGRRASNLTQAVLKALPQDQLSRKNAVYLADMSKMPSIITRTFALPKLRDLPYQMGVSMDETTLAAWPRQTDAVTLIELEKRVVKRINYVTNEADLRIALER